MVDEFRSIAATTSLDPELIYAMEFHHAECKLEVGELSRANEIETAAFGALDPNLSAKVQSKHDWLAAAIATATADYDDAERLIQEAFEGHRRGRLYDGDTLWMAGRLAVAQDIGGLEELLSFATTTASTSAYSRGAAEALAFALLELGSVDEARSIVAPFGPKAAFPDDYSTLCCAAAALHVRVELEDRPGAEVAAAQLVDYPERWAAAGSSPLSMGSVALALARFEAMRGDVGAARSSYLAAEEFHESNGAVAWLARTLTHSGRFLVDIGDTGPGERALARARELADVHGFVYVRRRLDEVSG
jgi:hypothetical protein